MQNSKPLNEFIKVRVSDFDKQILTRYCAKTGLDESKLIRYAIEQLNQNEIPTDFFTARERLLSENNRIETYKTVIYISVKQLIKRPVYLPQFHIMSFVWNPFRSLKQFCLAKINLEEFSTPELVAQAWDEYYVKQVTELFIQKKIEENRDLGNAIDESKIAEWKNELLRLDYFPGN